MRGKLLFAHLSSDRRGDLLVHSSGGALLLRHWLYFDPGTQQLLTTLRPAGQDREASQPPPASRPVLIDASSLEANPIQQSARLSLWLPPG